MPRRKLKGSDREPSASGGAAPGPDDDRPGGTTAAALANLVYVTDSEPGIRRFRRGKGFRYILPDGSPVADPAVKARIAALGLPPAYRQVWICLDENGHLQATGIDARDRKQYRYHNAWQGYRNGDKFAQLVSFGAVLPKIRRTIRRHMDGPPDSVQTVCAALVALLDEIHLRAGHMTYVHQNGTYGATTLLKRHVRFEEGCIRFSFTAKGGKRVRQVLRRPRLQRTLEEIADLPGRRLFAWTDARNIAHSVDSSRLNRYLVEIAGIAISAKTFRTWAGSVAAFSTAIAALSRQERPTIRQMSEAAAEILCNTPAVSRKSYIHPDILALAASDAQVPIQTLVVRSTELRLDETRMLDFLQRAERRTATK